MPRIKNYWSREKFMGIPDLHRYMFSTRFWALWRNLHLVDNQTIANTGGIYIQPLLVHCLLDKVGLRRGVTVSSEGVDTASSERVCSLE